MVKYVVMSRIISSIFFFLSIKTSGRLINYEIETMTGFLAIEIDPRMT